MRYLVLATLLLVSTSSLPADEKVRITPDVVYGHKLGLAMTFDVFTPPQANGAGVLFMVSGGWYSRWSDPQQAQTRFKPLTDAGFTVFSIRHGSSPKFQVPDAVSDVRRAVRYIRLNSERFQVDPERLGVFGFSAGGHLSLMLGTTPDSGDPKSKDSVLRTSSRVAAVVDYFGPSDLIPWVNEESPYYQNYPALQFDAKQARAMSPLFHVTADDAPTLMLHGDKDTLVPLDHSERILKEFQAKNVPAELIVVEGAAHGFRGRDAETSQAAMLKWFQQHLLPQE